MKTIRIDDNKLKTPRSKLRGTRLREVPQTISKVWNLVCDEAAVCVKYRKPLFESPLAYPRSKLRGSRLHDVPQTMRFAVLFNKAHAAFKELMVKGSNGVPFIGFDHPFLYTDEISYKHAVYHRTSEELQLEKWEKWKTNPGTILKAVKKACAISGNLLEHRFGPEGNSDSPLHLIIEDKNEALEGYLIDFFRRQCRIWI